MPAPGKKRITVTAAAISNVVKSRAASRGYSSSGQFPFIVGVDGVGRLDDGTRVYFLLPRVLTEAWRKRLQFLHSGDDSSRGTVFTVKYSQRLSVYGSFDSDQA